MLNNVMKYILPVIVFVPALLWGQTDATPSYRIYAVEQKREISLEELVEQLQNKEVVFFGEEHNDSVAHLVELLLLQGLHKQGKKQTILSMEMFQRDVQLVLDEYMKGLITESNLEKDGRLWKNYRDYRPLVEYARANGIYVSAANAPSRYTNRVTRSGLESLNDLTKAARSLLAPLPIDTLTGAYYEKFSELMGGHEGMGALKFYQSQNLWDATMAWSIARLLKKGRTKKQVLHLNGRFHSDEKLGTYEQLMRYAPTLRCANISSFSDTSVAAPKWDDWKKLGDFVIITEPVKQAAH
ncbi:MAG: ChaN family lipoprotein [Chitinophagaceae bacterium]|nr:ChaN family lipoprotein [Chitinophagaceae bacterium]